jgi:RecG-like helicase
MKNARLILTSVAAFAILALATPSFAAEPEKSGKEAKERTITGECKCAKCALKEADKCQNVIEAENAKGRKVKYYLADNDVSKDFHKNVCKEAKKVTVTGTVKKVDGKNELTATKIELAKE